MKATEFILGKVLRTLYNFHQLFRKTKGIAYGVYLSPE